jgi:chemotaxis protein histidine kinase CheA
MEKKSIFKKLDDFCNKVTIAIIGDIPHDGENQEENIPQTTQKTGITHTLTSAKEKFLNLGTPSDEKALLYEEVVKKEKQETQTPTPSMEEVTLEKSSTSQKNVIKKEKTPKETGTSPSVEVEEKPLEPQPETNTEDQTPSTAEHISTTKVEPNVQEEKTTEKKSIEKVKNTQKSTPQKEFKVPKNTTKKSEKTESKNSTDNKKSASKVTKKSQKKTEKPTSNKKPDGPAKKTEASKKSTDKPKKEKKGGKRAEKIELYAKHIKKYYGKVDKAFLTIVVKNLGPSIYKEDAELVSCSESKDLDYIRKQFLKKKLGIDASKKVLDAAIQDVCKELKSSRKKYRATFYYALAKKFKKESVLN